MLMMSMGPISSSQIGILPSVEITCDDPGPVEVWPGATRTTIVYCTLENPSIHSESVEIGTESEESDFEFLCSSDCDDRSWPRNGYPDHH